MNTNATHAGQVVYTKSFLSVYDLFVVRFSNNYIWRCPRSEMLDFYKKHMGENHLDIGVGTGFYLHHALSSTGTKNISLLDLNPNSIQKTVAELRAHEVQVETIEGDALTYNTGQQAYDSIGINFLLHCLPGRIEEKLSAIIVNYQKGQPGKNTQLFGSTILGQGVPTTWLSRKVAGIYQTKGIFGNADDSLKGLEATLHQYSKQVSLCTVGSVALFAATI